MTTLAMFCMFCVALLVGALIGFAGGYQVGFKSGFRASCNRSNGRVCRLCGSDCGQCGGPILR